MKIIGLLLIALVLTLVVATVTTACPIRIIKKDKKSTIILICPCLPPIKSVSTSKPTLTGIYAW